MSQHFSRREALRLGALAAGGAALLGSGALTGCASRGSMTDPNAYSFGPPQDGVPTPGGTLRVGLISGGNAETLDVRRTTQVPDIARVSALYDPLWFVGERGTVVAGLAESWDSNDAADVWTIQLRRGVQWHDGKSFTAADVVYTIQNSWVAPENGFGAVLQQIIDAPNVRADGEFTVVVPLKRRLAQFPTVASIQNCYVVPDGFTSWDRPVGTGPFKFKSFTAGRQSEFVANENYWRGSGRPPVDSLIIDSSFAQDDTRLNALLAKSIDIMPGIPPALARANQSAGRINLGNQPGPGWTGPVFRVDTEPFRDQRVREALKLSLDRQAAVDLVFSGYATAGNDCCGYTGQYFANDLTSSYDPDKAKSLLKSAGFDGLAVSLDTAALSGQTNSLATLFKEQAKKAGIDVTVNQSDPSTYFTPAGGYQTRPFSMELWTNGVNSLTLFYLLDLVEGAPFQVSYWGSPEHDELAYAAMAEKDEARAAQKWHDVQVLQHNEGGTLNYANYNWLDGYGLGVRGTKTTNAGPCNNFDFSSTWLEG
ncbi:ABC transporter substrate-binding protein [Rhodococcus sp. NPDC057529]|uniref:ABC transporter substrate-binding protein n=1 Tax=Rhodococcus sp. NPDC057529 TaxID=3346158 RepID=UPI00366A6B4A